MFRNAPHLQASRLLTDRKDINRLKRKIMMNEQYYYGIHN